MQKDRRPFFKLLLSISVGLTKNYKAGISFNFTKKSIAISTNLGIGAGYSLAYAYSLSWNIGWGFKSYFAGWFGHTNYFDSKYIDKVVNIVDKIIN